jgi:hypothetical protein
MRHLPTKQGVLSTENCRLSPTWNKFLGIHYVSTWLVHKVGEDISRTRNKITKIVRSADLTVHDYDRSCYRMVCSWVNGKASAVHPKAVKCLPKQCCLIQVRKPVHTPPLTPCLACHYLVSTSAVSALFLICIARLHSSEVRHARLHASSSCIKSVLHDATYNSFDPLSWISTGGNRNCPWD